jgi:hypothetical protein
MSPALAAGSDDFLNSADELMQSGAITSQQAGLKGRGSS